MSHAWRYVCDSSATQRLNEAISRGSPLGAWVHRQTERGDVFFISDSMFDSATKGREFNESFKNELLNFMFEHQIEGDKMDILTSMLSYAYLSSKVCCKEETLQACKIIFTTGNPLFYNVLLDEPVWKDLVALIQRTFELKSTSNILYRVWLVQPKGSPLDEVCLYQKRVHCPPAMVCLNGGVWVVPPVDRVEDFVIEGRLPFNLLNHKPKPRMFVFKKLVDKAMPLEHEATDNAFARAAVKWSRHWHARPDRHDNGYYAYDYHKPDLESDNMKLSQPRDIILNNNEFFPRH